jgi:hypothetical protein
VILRVVGFDRPSPEVPAFGSCCSDLRDALALPEVRSFLVSEETGALLVTIATLHTDEGPGYCDQRVIFCPFCGKHLQSLAKIRKMQQQQRECRSVVARLCDARPVGLQNILEILDPLIEICELFLERFQIVRLEAVSNPSCPFQIKFTSRDKALQIRLALRYSLVSRF